MGPQERCVHAHHTLQLTALNTPHRLPIYSHLTPHTQPLITCSSQHTQPLIHVIPQLRNHTHAALLIDTQPPSTLHTIHNMYTVPYHTHSPPVCTDTHRCRKIHAFQTHKCADLQTDLSCPLTQILHTIPLNLHLFLLHFSFSQHTRTLQMRT